MRKEKLEKLKNIIEELKVVKQTIRNIEYERKFLQSEAYSFTLNNGRVILRERLIKGKNDGSAVIIVPVIDNEILTVIEPRVFTKLTVGVGFPAGYVEYQENVEEAALRELREETGLVPSELIKLDSFYQDEGCSAALNHIYLALNCSQKFNQELDESEIIRYMKFTYEELLELEKMGYIMGGNTKLALAKTKQY